MLNTNDEFKFISAIDLKKKLEEIEVRKKIEQFEKHLSSFDEQPHYFLVLVNLKLQINDLKGALHYLNIACSLFQKWN